MDILIVCDDIVKEFFESVKQKLEPEVQVDIRDNGVVLSSDKFKNVEQRDDRVVIFVDEEIFRKFEGLGTFVIPLCDIENGKILNTRVEVLTRYTTLEAKCPFCGTKAKYHSALAPYVFPKTCIGCKCDVFVDVGDEGDILETLAEMFEEDVEFNVEEDRIVSTDERIIALKIQDEKDEEGESFGIYEWLIFVKR